MKTYIVSLIRSYAVTIEAENEENACRYAEFFIGNCHDLSIYKDKQKINFQLQKLSLLSMKLWMLRNTKTELKFNLLNRNGN